MSGERMCIYVNTWAMFFTFSLNLLGIRLFTLFGMQECLKRCMDLIRGGASVFFFPEGTRSKDGKLGAFQVRYMRIT